MLLTNLIGIRHSHSSNDLNREGNKIKIVAVLFSRKSNGTNLRYSVLEELKNTEYINLSACLYSKFNLDAFEMRCSKFDCLKDATFATQADILK